jgi:hypothetical protein
MPPPLYIEPSHPLIVIVTYALLAGMWLVLVLAAIDSIWRRGR